MRSSIALAALLGLSQAMPAIVERDPVWVTVTVYENAYTTVTDFPTPIGRLNWNGFRGGRHGNPKQPAPQTTAIPSSAPASVPQPDPSPAPAPAPEPEPEPSYHPVSESEAPQPPPSSPAEPTTPVATTPAATSTPASSPGAPASNNYNDLVVFNHNVHRANHSAPAVAWNQSLADTALRIAQSCVYAHNTKQDGGGYGQNIAAGAPISQIANVITGQFYNGEVNNFVDYGQATPADFNSAFESYGHFTQVVWVGSVSVGCASVDCSSSGLQNVGGNVPPIFHVCNYFPPGNYLGEFDKNVLRSLNQATYNP